jgi:TfoX/Sxy family transcriptional regulator of competence genes
MAYNEKLAERVSTALAHIKEVKPKMMFSGVAFLVNGKMCVNVTSEGLMCRMDPALHDSLIEKQGCQSMVMKGKELKGWIVVKEDVLKTTKALNDWIALALNYNEFAKAAKKKKKANITE